MQQNTLLRSTKSLAIAAAFLSLGATYAGCDRSNPHNIEFKFYLYKQQPIQFETGALKNAVQEKEELIPLPFDEWEAAWINKKCPVNGPDYYDALKTLKNVIHSSSS